MEISPIMISSRFLDAGVLLKLVVETNLHLEVENVYSLDTLLANRVGNYIIWPIMKYFRVEM